MSTRADSAADEAARALVDATSSIGRARASRADLQDLLNIGIQAVGGDAGAIVIGGDSGPRTAVRSPDPGADGDGPLAAAERALHPGIAEIAESGATDIFARIAGEEAIGALVMAAGRPLGVLVVIGADADGVHPLRRRALEVVAARAGELIAAARTRTRLERAMAEILESDERMLARIGLDIHDGPTQALSVALLEVQLLESELDAAGDEASADLRQGISRIYETLGGALHEMRELIGHLRPAQFEDRRLPDILDDAVVTFRARSECEVDVRIEGGFPVNSVSASQRITFFRILQEALTNAHRHGRAHRVKVTLRESDAGVSLTVVDDGVGFDPADVQRKRPGQPLQRFGLHGMRERATVLDGTFEIRSAPGEGATVHVFLPSWSPEDEDGEG